MGSPLHQPLRYQNHELLNEFHGMRKILPAVPQRELQFIPSMTTL